MDIESKIFSSIMCTRLFKIIKTNGVKYPFGSTPGVGFQDGSFTIKTMLHLRYNHNLPTFVMFADLVKAFDTSNHKLMVDIWKKYRCPPKLCSDIRRMYTDNNMILILEKIYISIPFEVGVKQGHSVALVIFLFIMMSFSETLEEEWVKNDLQMMKFRRKSNSPQSSGRITSHPENTFSQGILFELFCMIYVDDGTFAFKRRKETEIGSNLVFNHFRCFGLQMHIGSKSKPSKTECVFFPAPNHFKITDTSFN